GDGGGAVGGHRPAGSRSSWSEGACRRQKYGKNPRFFARSGRTVPSRWASATRERRPSLRRALRTCLSTVWGDRNSSSAISLLVQPSAASPATSARKSVVVGQDGRAR